jgi:hypothetical protein
MPLVPLLPLLLLLLGLRSAPCWGLSLRGGEAPWQW